MYLAPKEFKMPKDRLIGEDYCLNCDALLTDKAWYCHQCGQKCTDGRISILELLREFFEAVFDLDSRFFRTLRYLFIPGVLTNEYFLGRRKKYVHPLRLFLVTGIIFFTLASIITSQYADRQLQRFTDSFFREDAFKLQFIQEIDSIRVGLVDSFDQNPIIIQAYDSLILEAKETIGSDSISLGSWKFEEDWSIKQVNLSIAKLDMLKYSGDDIANRYGIDDFLGQLIVKQLIRVITHLDRVVDSAISQFIWTFLFTLILLGFGLKLLYIRRRLYYVEHLVFSFHFHAFTFLLTSILIFLYWVMPSYISTFSAVLLPGVFIVGWFYLFLAMKRVYRQHWFKTFIKFAILNFMYLILFTFALSISAIVTYFFY